GVVGFRTTPGLIPRYPSGLAWDTYSVEGPMARTIANTALMLSVMAGADDRSPISYEVDPRELVQATKMPSVKGWRVAWTSDLGGLMTIDDEVRGVFESAISAFRSGGARVEEASPDLGDVPEMVRLRGAGPAGGPADRGAPPRGGGGAARGGGLRGGAALGGPRPADRAALSLTGTRARARAR